MIEINNITVNYAKQCVICDLNLNIAAGNIYALLGGNGAGKTTTINTLLGFVKPYSGSASINGLDVNKHTALTRFYTAYLPENVALYPYLTGIENLSYFCSAAGIALTAKEAAYLLSKAGLQAEAHRKRVAGYSKGMRQKVGIAIAYAKEAKVLLLDEPTSGLDPNAANDFSQHIKQAALLGMSVLMATHDLFNAKQLADYIGIMQQGKLVDEFSSQAVDHSTLEHKYLAHARGFTS